MGRILTALVGIALAAGWPTPLPAREGHPPEARDSGRTAEEIVRRGIPDKGVAPCQSCHGERGESPVPMYPHLAGQYRSYLAHALRAYRDGERVNATMNQQAQKLTDREIEALAAYFATRKEVLQTPDW